MREIARFDQRETADQVLRFGVRSVGDGVLAADDFALSFERLPAVLDMSLAGEIFEPAHPFLHDLLAFGGRLAAPATAIKKHVFTHV